MPVDNNYRVYGSDEQEKVETLLLQKQDVLDMVDIATSQTLVQRQKRSKKRRTIEDTGMHKDKKAIFSKENSEVKVDDKDNAQKVGEVKKEEKEKKKTSLLVPLVILGVLGLAVALTVMPMIKDLFNKDGVVDNNTENTVETVHEEYIYSKDAKLKAPSSDTVWTIEKSFDTADQINSEIINYFNEFVSLSEAKSKGFSVGSALDKLRSNIDEEIRVLVNYTELYENYNMRSYIDLSIDRYNNFKDMVNAVNDSMTIDDFNSTANGYILRDKDLLANTKITLTQALTANGYEVQDLGDRLSYHKISEEDSQVETHDDLQPDTPVETEPNPQEEVVEQEPTVEVTYPLEITLMQYGNMNEEDFVKQIKSLGLHPFHETTWDAYSDTIPQGFIVKHGAGEYVKSEQMRYGLSLGKKQ